MSNIREILMKEGTGYTRNKNLNKTKSTQEQKSTLTNEEFGEIMKQCENKSKEEIQRILRTPKGKILVQEFARTIFPKKQ